MSTIDMTDLDTDRAEWERWRGRTDALVQAQVQQFASLAASMRTDMANLDRNMNRRFDKSEVEWAEIKAQVTYTNGNVRELKEWRANIEGQEKGELKIEAKIEQTDAVLERRRQFSLGTLVASIGAAAASIGALATAGVALHLF